MTTDRWTCAVLAAMLLLAGGCGKKRGDSTDHTLRSAAYRGDVAQVQSLIVRGLSVHDMNRALSVAAEQGRLEVVQLLVRCGARIDCQDDRGQRPIMLALAENQREVVEYLVDEGAAVNLQVAAYLGDAAKVKELIDSGADVDAIGSGGWRPLHLAASQNQAEVARLLIAAGADLNARADHEDYRDDSAWGTALHCAVAGGYAGLVELLLDSGADIDAPDKYGVSPLLQAARWGQAGMVRMLIARGANPNARSEDNVQLKGTPLGAAVEEGFIDVVELLIAAGVDLNMGDGTGWRPLHVAVTSRFSAGVRAAMAKAHPEPDAPRGNSGGYYRAHDEILVAFTTRMVELLIGAGAHVNGSDNWGLTPLHCAAYRGNRVVVETLLSNGADVNARTSGEIESEDMWQRDWAGRLGPGVTPLHEAVVADPNMVDLLLAHGAQVNARDDAGDSPLHYAAVRSGERAVALLIAGGADVNARDNYGATPLVVALRNGSVAEAKRLIAAGAERVAVRDHPATMLIELIENGRERGLLLHGALRPGLTGWVPKYDDLATYAQHRSEWIELLLEYGADLEDRDDEGNTPLHVAVCDGDEKSAALFLAHGADVNARNYVNVTPLHLTACDRRTELTSLLLDHGADVNARADDGDTPLHNAALRGRRDVVEVLLAHGADPGVANSRGRTPLDEAVRHGHGEVVQLLTDRHGGGR